MSIPERTAAVSWSLLPQTNDHLSAIIVDFMAGIDYSKVTDVHQFICHLPFDRIN